MASKKELYRRLENLENLLTNAGLLNQIKKPSLETKYKDRITGLYTKVCDLPAKYKDEITFYKDGIYTPKNSTKTGQWVEFKINPELMEEYGPNKDKRHKYLQIHGRKNFYNARIFPLIRELRLEEITQNTHPKPYRRFPNTIFHSEVVFEHEDVNLYIWSPIFTHSVVIGMIFDPRLWMALET